MVANGLRDIPTLAWLRNWYQQRFGASQVTADDYLYQVIQNIGLYNGDYYTAAVHPLLDLTDEDGRAIYAHFCGVKERQLMWQRHILLMLDYYLDKPDHVYHAEQRQLLPYVAYAQRLADFHGLSPRQAIAAYKAAQSMASTQASASTQPQSGLPWAIRLHMAVTGISDPDFVRLHDPQHASDPTTTEATIILPTRLVGENRTHQLASCIFDAISRFLAQSDTAAAPNLPVTVHIADRAATTAAGQHEWHFTVQPQTPNLLEPLPTTAIIPTTPTSESE